jgi:uncharacterized protein
MNFIARLMPREGHFFILFDGHAKLIVEGAVALADLLRHYDTVKDRAAGIKSIEDAEHAADRITHETVQLLHTTFVTPFDRDDIFRLATSLDDICDLVDDAAQNLELYDVRRIPERAREQGNVIHRAARELDAGVRHLDGFRDASDELHGLRELEDEGDRILRLAVAELFRSGQDPLSIIRWKDIHEQLEEAVDGFQTAADVLEAILVKNR